LTDPQVVPEGIVDAIKRGDRPGPKTGPKGVLADYKAFKLAEYNQKADNQVRNCFDGWCFPWMVSSAWNLGVRSGPSDDRSVYSRVATVAQE
jgi:hypothetical protein